MADAHYIVTFPTTHMTLRAERVAKSGGVAVKVIPVPRQLSADCNMGIKVSLEDADSLRSLLDAANVSCAFVGWPKR